MRTFPDITPAAIDGWEYWWVVLIPVLIALLALGLEYLIRKKSPTSDFRGSGFGIAALSAAVLLLMSVAFIPEAVGDREDLNMIEALEEIGFQEVRMNFDEGTFGAYYEGELMRGVVIEIQSDEGTYKVVETPPPALVKK